MPTLAVAELEVSEKSGRTRIGVGLSKRTLCIFATWVIIVVSIVTTVLVVKSKQFDKDAAKSNCEFDCKATLSSCNFDCGSARSDCNFDCVRYDNGNRTCTLGCVETGNVCYGVCGSSSHTCLAAC